MFLKKLKLVDYRNYKKKEFKFEEGINVIIGRNGTGKTNVLEALFLLSTSTSHKTNWKKYLIRRGENGFAVIADLFDKKIKYSFKAKYSSGSGYETSLNSSVVKRDEFIKKFPVILFSPQDVEIIGGSPSGLRRMLNINIAQTYPEYANYLRRYKKVLKERNALLKDISENEDNALLKSFTDMLKKAARPIVEKRKLFIEKINKNIQTEAGGMNISKNFKIDYDRSSYTDSSDDLKDIRYGYTTWGPQRDTFEFLLDSQSIKNYGSRGEHKLAVILYRLAHWNYIKEKRKVEPLILLDDVFGELDFKMRETLKERIENVQAVITATEKPEVIGEKAEIIKL